MTLRGTLAKVNRPAQALLAVLLLASLSIVFFAIASKAPTSSAQSDKCKELPSTTLTENAPITTKYKLWAYVKAEARDATPYVQINGGDCKALELPAGEDWTWVSSGDPGIIEDFKAGVQEFKFSVEGSSVLIDKFLITSELSCHPVDDGRNCVELPLTFTVTGLSPNEVVRDPKDIGVQFAYPDQLGTKVEYAFDDQPPAEAQPGDQYCLQAGQDGNCGAYDFSSMSEGEHVLKVSAYTPAGQRQAKSIPFTIDRSQEQPEGSSSTSNASSDGELFKIVGINNNDIVKGGRAVSIELLDQDFKSSITYRLDGKILVARDEAPYCLRTSNVDGVCGEWDTTVLSNGEHELVAVTTVEGLKDVWQSVKFTIDNEPPTDAEKTTTPSQEVILGNGDQQATGMTRFSVPNKWVNKDSEVKFTINGQEVAKASGETAFADIDTTGYVNGVYTVAASLRSPDGTEDSLSSRVTIKNNRLTSFATWVKTNKVLAALSLITIIGSVYAAVFVANRWMHHRRFIKSHKMADYDKQTEEFIFKFFNRMPHLPKKYTRYSLLASSGASLVVVGLIVLALRVGQPLPAAGLGFISEIEDGSTSENSPFKLGHDGSKQQLYVRLGDGSQPLEGDHVATHGSDGLGGTGSTTPVTSTPGSTGGSGGGTGGGGGGTQQPPPTASCTPGIGVLDTMGPCINRSLIPGSVLGYSTIRVDTTAPITQNNGEPGAFRQRCDYSHMNADDPLLYINRPGAAHLHTFFGNTGANAYSTSNSLRNSGNSTCAGGIFNRSAYWVPSLIDTATGRPIRPRDDRTPQYHSDLEIYYKHGYQGVGYEDMQPFPNGLQMIAGNAANATSPTSGSRVKYYCENGSDPWSRFFGLPSSDGIPASCSQGNIIVMTVDFPQCWNGQLTSPNGRSHLAYGQWQPGENRYTRGCPGSHPIGLPSVMMIVRWTVEAANAANYRLSSDNYTSGPGGYSGHADYVFAWDEGAFPTVKTRCYAAMMDCGYQLGDGREPRWTRSR